MGLQLGQIVAALGGCLEGGDPQTPITRIAPLESADAHSISFLHNPRYAAQLAQTQAACVIVAPAMREAALAHGACITTPDPYAYFARLTQLWQAQQPPAWPQGVHPTAVVHPEARVDPSASVGPHCTIERGAVVGAQTVLRARVHIGQGCTIGERCILHPGVVIGADGFGFAKQNGQWQKIEQLGAVVIGDDVEIGANTTIDRGALADTVIHEGVKLDNQIQIAHNCIIGAHTAIASCVGIAGSSTIGARCMIGGAAMIGGHLSIPDGTVISGATAVPSTLTEAGQYSGIFPPMLHRDWERNASLIRHLSDLRKRLRALEKASS